MEQPGLFDAGAVPAPEEIALTLLEGPMARPARVGFLTGMLALWTCGGKPSEAQRQLLAEIARDALRRAHEVNPEGAR